VLSEGSGVGIVGALSSFCVAVSTAVGLSVEGTTGGGVALCRTAATGAVTLAGAGVAGISSRGAFLGHTAAQIAAHAASEIVAVSSLLDNLFIVACLLQQGTLPQGREDSYYF
jgi:hypothetical protein